MQGILQTKNYFDFIILSDTGNLLHTFSSSKAANKCMPGDHVKWNSEKEVCELELRDEYPMIVGTLELSNKTKYGMTSRGIPIYLFTPYDKKYPQFIVGSSEKDTSHNKVALIKFDEWKDNSTFPRGQLQQLLGNSCDFNVEKQALIWQASPWKYPKGKWEPKTKEEFVREKIEGYTINIDPEGCKDIDDVITFQEISHNTWKIIITISDVARYVEDNSVEDIFASVIGQTLYVNGQVERPMLPQEYSEEVCSLKPNKISHGVSLEILWNIDNNSIDNIRWFLSELENNRSYTYEEFQNKDTKYRDILYRFSCYLANCDINDSHKWIEECMKYYNTEAGKLLKTHNMGILRKHSKPNMEKLEAYSKYIPDIQFLAYSSAEYCLSEDNDTTHYGLNTNTYTHATSPIRRYADLINQRILKIIINNTDDQYIVPQSMYDMNSRQKAIKRFQRDYDFICALEGYNKKIYNGTIINIKHKENTEYVQLHIWIKEWKRIIKATYKLIKPGIILSADESQYIPIELYKDIQIKCTCSPNNRNWKERIIINIINE
jgi:exoribonuclease R